MLNKKTNKILCSIFLITVILFSQVIFLNNPNIAYAEDNRTSIGGLAGINWNVPATTNINKVSMDISINEDIDPSSNIYICALGGFFNDVGFYCGIQTNVSSCFISKKDQGIKPRFRGAIYSRWSERDLSAVSMAEGGSCQSAGYEGDFVGVRNPFNWKQGQYNIQLKVIKSGFGIPQDDKNIWVGMFIYSYDDKTNTYMGAIRYPGTTLNLNGGSLYSFVEVYGPPISVDQVPNRKIGFSNLRINDNILKLNYANVGYQKNTNNTGKAIVTNNELQVLTGKDVNDQSKFNYTYSPDGSSYFENLDVSQLKNMNNDTIPDVVDNTEAIQKPGAITATVDQKSVTLNWSAPPNAEKCGLAGYYIYRETDGEGTNTEPLNIAMLSTATYIDKNISLNKTYHYYVTAVNKFEIESVPSDKIDVKTDYLDCPKDLKSVMDGNQITLNWNNPATGNVNDIAGFNIFRGTNSGMEETNPVNSSLITSTTYSESLPNDRSYYYVVKAVNKNGVSSDYSNETVVKAVVPKPLNITATIDNSKVFLKWNSPSSDDIAGYNVYRTSDIGTVSSPINKEIINNTSFMDDTIEAGNTYYYYVTAINKNGIESDLSDKVEMKVIQPASPKESSTTKKNNGVAPGKPLNLTAKANKKQITLSWKAPTGNSPKDIVGYYIYRGTKKGNEVSKPVNKTTIKSTSYVDTSVSQNSTYYYIVKAVNKYGVYSVQSNEVTIKTLK